MKPIRVILADDHEVVRSGISARLNGLDDIQVVGEAENGLVLLDLVRELNPDVVVVDIEMEKLNGLQAMAEAIKGHPHLGGVVLSMHEALPYIKRAFSYGALGYVSKQDKSTEIISAIRHAAKKERYLSPRARTGDINETIAPSVDDNPLKVLTHREYHVLQLVAEGKTNADSAKILGVSVRTIEVHRSQVMKKLGLKNHAELVKFATRHNVIPPSDL